MSHLVAKIGKYLVKDPYTLTLTLTSLSENATSENNTSDDWEAIIGICEEADTSEYAAREAVGALAKRMVHRNVNVKTK